MPHLHMEYTANLPQLNADVALMRLNNALVGSGQFAAEFDIKSRAVKVETFKVGTAMAERALRSVGATVAAARVATIPAQRFGTPEEVAAMVTYVASPLASATTGISPILASWGWIEGKTLFMGTATSAMDKITFWNFALPVMTIALYGIGYIARMTRASMTEVMTAQYIRTARLKGVSFGQVVIRHALRNALIAPFTVIMLQFPWLLNGVVIVETLFNFKGFGWTLVQAATNNDIELLLGCSVVAVVLVLITQLISDIGYVFLNPRIRLS